MTARRFQDGIAARLRPFGHIDETLATLKRTRRIVLTVNQFFTAGVVVANSDLLTVLPRHFLSSTGTTDKVAVRALPFELPRVDVHAMWHRSRATRSGHEWLRSSIVRAAATPLRERAPGRPGVSTTGAVSTPGAASKSSAGEGSAARHDKR